MAEDNNTAVQMQIDALIQPGAAFELMQTRMAGAPVRLFRNAPPSLGAVYRVAQVYGERVFLVSDDVSMTYAQVFGQAQALANRLSVELRPLHGKRVAIAMQNSPEWMIAFIAVTAGGGTAALINSRGTGAEIAAALRDAAVDLVIADTARAQLILAEGWTRPLVLSGNSAALGATAAPIITFASAIAGWENAALTPVDVQPDDNAVIIFTSGTTGGSKPALLSQRSVITGLMNIQYAMAVVGVRIAAQYGSAVLAAGNNNQTAALLCMPLFHSAGCYAVFLSNLMRGGKIVILPKWNAERAVELIERERIVAISGSPAMLWDLLRLDRSGRDLSSLRSIGVGGQALQPQLLRELVAAFPQAMLGGGYGMTESNGSVCMIAGADLLAHPSASGQVIPSADLQIVDDAGAPVPAGAIGEIWLRGAMLMREYCGNPAATAAALADGWLRTGDIGRLDDAGYLHVVDRKKDIVISGGENISCVEVEGVVMEYPGVLDAAAFAVIDERLGERLAVAVVTQPGASVDSEALKNYVAGRLAIYKVPRAVMYARELPRNALGKVSRQLLQQRFLDGGDSSH